MADIELVIKIDEEQYEFIKENITTYYEVKDYHALMYDFCERIRNGTPLPKGHGDLVDFDKLCEEYWDGNYLEIHRDKLASIQPIIEADKAESEDNDL